MKMFTNMTKKSIHVNTVLLRNMEVNIYNMLWDILSFLCYGMISGFLFRDILTYIYVKKKLVQLVLNVLNLIL